MPTDTKHNPFLDGLVELVGQERADKAVELATKARAHTAALLREVTEAVDPAADQRELVEELKATVERRDQEINLLNDTIRQLKEAAELDAAEIARLQQEALERDDILDEAEATAEAPEGTEPVPPPAG